MPKPLMPVTKRALLSSIGFLVGFVCGQGAWAQTLESYPGYDRVQQVAQGVRQWFLPGRVTDVTWSDDGKKLTFKRGDEWKTLNLETGELGAGTPPQPSKDEERTARRRGPGRARQRTEEPSPDGAWTARYENYNVILEQNESKVRTLVTTTGTERFRYGTACWVYGEELDQQEAMWWSPDSKKLVFYEIDERHMRDYLLTNDNTKSYTSLEKERYPKAGDSNPYVALLVYDRVLQTTTRIDTGPIRDAYLFNVKFAPNGELLYSRTNRHQNELEVIAVDLEHHRSRLVVKESQAAWQKNRPLMRFLSDQQRFIWETERNGWKHFELRHLDGRLLNPLSVVAEYPCETVVQVDEAHNWFYYTALSDPQGLCAQLHRVRLDGSGHQCLTPDELSHSSIQISPDHRWVIAQQEAIGVPPITKLFRADGKPAVTLATSDTSRLKQQGLHSGELFSFPTADGATEIHGVMYKPSNFDPAKQYPLVVSVYGGPGSTGFRNRFVAARPECEYGFVYAVIANRGTANRGKAFETAGYQKLGIVDIADQAEGVRFLGRLPFIDSSRVGIFGHSYGGYMSALAVLKYPDLFHVAVAGAPVTDWRNYDTIYTERYMRTPQENPEGYRDGSCLTYASQLKGKLLLVHGLIDDNVHPANTWQLVEKLHEANKRFDLQVFPNHRHGIGSPYPNQRWEYLITHLKPEPVVPPSAEASSRP